jgi:hypothetical protein
VVPVKVAAADPPPSHDTVIPACVHPPHKRGAAALGRPEPLDPPEVEPPGFSIVAILTVSENEGDREGT